MAIGRQLDWFYAHYSSSRWNECMTFFALMGCEIMAVWLGNMHGRAYSSDEDGDGPAATTQQYDLSSGDWVQNGNRDTRKVRSDSMFQLINNMVSATDNRDSGLMEQVLRQPQNF